MQLAIFKSLTLLFLVIALFSIRSAHADAVANIMHPGNEFFSKNKSAKAVIDNDVRTFTVFVDGKKQWTSEDNPELQLGNLFVSNDGHFVTWMLRGAFLSSNKEKTIPGLIFYKDGKVLKSWLYQDLIVRPEFVSQSTSHTKWLNLIDPNSKNPTLVLFADDASKLQFETTSFRRYEFNPQTGEEQKAEDSPIYKEADWIIYGVGFEIGPKQADGCWISPKKVGFLKGEKPSSKLRFLDPNCSISERDAKTVILSKKDGGLKVVATIDTIYNRLLLSE